MTGASAPLPDTPLLTAVLEAARSPGLRLQTPVHQGHPAWRERWPDWASADVTENEATDDLGWPEGPLQEARLALARHFGARASWFSVGGATLAQQAAFWALAITLARRGRPPAVLVDQNAHVSVLRAMALAGLEPVWFGGAWDADWGVRHPPTPEDLKRLLDAHPDTGAVHLTAPTYFGEDADLAGVRAMLGDVLMVVDEAHGAHRPSALAAGADLVVHSAHKGLGGPTQGGYLHLGGVVIDEATVDRAMRLLQTTSPSWPLLAALDATRSAASRQDASRMATDDWLAGLRLRPTPDPVRRLVAFPDGAAAYAALRTAGHWPEAALPRGVLLLVGGVGEVRDDLLEVARCLHLEAARQRGLPRLPVPEPPVLGKALLGLREASLAPAVTVNVRDAVGRVAVEPVCPYPPGVAVVVPGHLVSEDQLAFLELHGALPERLQVLP
ncbi:MAG: hypothetical protein VKP57_11620 [Candidatus Sericytochromatia bacterium]|nr:hypothetical protein [Candidatus Sericytochromatia bacterium]